MHSTLTVCYICFFFVKQVSSQHFWLLLILLKLDCVYHDVIGLWIAYVHKNYDLS